MALPLLLLLLVVSRIAAAGTLIDLEALGADQTQITSMGGQTFIDIGTALGAPGLVGVDLRVSGAGSPLDPVNSPGDGMWDLHEP